MLGSFGRFGYKFLTAGASGMLLTSSLVTSKQPFGVHAELNDVPLLRHAPPVKKVSSGPDTLDLNLRMYQYNNCPFCCKVRAFLDYYGFSYELVEVNPVTKKEIKFSNYKKVPIVVINCDGQLQLNDSSVIISILRSYMCNPSKDVKVIENYYPSVAVEKGTKKSDIVNPNKYFVMFPEESAKVNPNSLGEERKWRQWVDDYFVHLISPNVYSTMKESLATFRWFSEASDWRNTFSTTDRLVATYIGATAMYFVAKMLSKKHNIQSDVRQSLYDGCNEWLNAIGPSRTFMGGDSPNLADLAMYGALASFEGCEAFAQARRSTKIGDWFDRVKEQVQSRAGSKELVHAMQKRTG